VREARARLDQARGAQAAAPRPAGAERSRPPIRRRPPGQRLPDRLEPFGSRSSPRYEIDLWGRLASASDAARQRLLAEQWARASIAWSLTAQLAEAHFTLRAVQRQVEISEAVRASRAATLSLRRREQSAGIGNEFDLRRAEAELAATDATLVTLARQRVDLEATLALLAGRPLAEIRASKRRARRSTDAVLRRGCRKATPRRCCSPGPTFARPKRSSPPPSADIAAAASRDAAARSLSRARSAATCARSRTCSAGRAWSGRSRRA
jgi:outer membrane protein TolC